MEQRVRAFISSPGDVQAERRMAALTAERLSRAIDGLEIECFLWEDGRYFSAHAGFQDRIPATAADLPVGAEANPEAGGFDLVIGILWTRIGTPSRTLPQMPDGRPYPSGTAYELLTAIRARQQGQALPDILVYRKTEDARVSAKDITVRRRNQEEFEALSSFLEEWFFNETDGFKAAFFDFETTDGFANLLEQHLRNWLDEKGFMGRERRWRIETRGEGPFRGLQAFEVRHEDVFFGRDPEIHAAKERLDRARDEGWGALLLLGQRDVGKSSLARAGLLPYPSSQPQPKRSLAEPEASPQPHLSY